VEITPLLLSGEDVLVAYEDLDGNRHEYRLSPLPVDPISGLREDAALIGEEYRSAPDNAAVRSEKQLEAIAWPGLDAGERTKAKRNGATPFEARIASHSYLDGLELPEYMRRRGTELAAPGHARVEAAPLSHVAAARRLVSLLGRALTRAEFQSLQQRYPDGVPEDAVTALAERIAGGHQGDPTAHTA